MVRGICASVRRRNVLYGDDGTSCSLPLRFVADRGGRNCGRFGGRVAAESRKDEHGGAVAAEGNSSSRGCIRHLLSPVHICVTVHRARLVIATIRGPAIAYLDTGSPICCPDGFLWRHVSWSHAVPIRQSYGWIDTTASRANHWARCQLEVYGGPETTRPDHQERLRSIAPSHWLLPRRRRRCIIIPWKSLSNRKCSLLPVEYQIVRVISFLVAVMRCSWLLSQKTVCWVLSKDNCRHKV